jgi:hypothetical protein
MMGLGHFFGAHLLKKNSDPLGGEEGSGFAAGESRTDDVDLRLV